MIYMHPQTRSLNAEVYVAETRNRLELAGRVIPLLQRLILKRALTIRIIKKMKQGWAEKMLPVNLSMWGAHVIPTVASWQKYAVELKRTRLKFSWDKQRFWYPTDYQKVYKYPALLRRTLDEHKLQEI